MANERLLGKTKKKERRKQTREEGQGCNSSLREAEAGGSQKVPTTREILTLCVLSRAVLSSHLCCLGTVLEEATLLDDSSAPDGTQRNTKIHVSPAPLWESAAFTFTMQTHLTGAYTGFNFVPTARELRDGLPTEETAHSITGARSCLSTQDPRGTSRLSPSGCQTLSAAPDHYPHLSSRPEEGKGNRMADNFLLVKGLCPQGPLPPHLHGTGCVP